MVDLAAVPALEAMTVWTIFALPAQYHILADQTLLAATLIIMSDNLE